MVKSKFIDDKIEHIEDDIEKIRTKTSMYISYLGSQGSLHLAKEIINNSIDECINTNSPADFIEIFLDESENTLTVSDNGRGIPPDKLKIVCTKLQSGSKFFRGGTGSTSAGENGVGITACAALSNIFELISFRDGSKYKITLNEGKIVKDVTETSIKDKEKHGTTTIMKPSSYILGEDCGIIPENLIEWIEKIVYLIPKDITIKLGIKRKGKESIVNKKYTNKEGLYDYIKKLCKKPLLDPIHFFKTTEVKETKRGETYEKFIGLEVAFTYDPDSVEFVADSFCNYVNTIDNGVHVDSVKTGIMQYFTKHARESLSERESKKLDIIPSDVYQGLLVTVSLSTDMDIQFNSQVKHKVTNNEFFKPLKDMTYVALKNYFEKNPKELKKYIDKIKVNAKARVESTKVRNSVIKGESNNFEEHFLMENFDPANNKGKNDYRELFIIEGKSARGSASAGRYDKGTQAVFSLRGVPLNSFNAKLDKVLLNKELNALVKILGCNIGARFDIDKLKYNKIIIMADSDSDGFNITSLMCAFFMTHMPELVKRGYIYKAVAPLYKIKSKYKKFILNKQEYVEIFEKQIRENLRISDIETGKVYNDKEMQNFLLINRNYLEELHRTANHLAIDPILLEFVITHLNEKDMLKKFHEKFPEMMIEDGVMNGIYEGKYQIMIMDHIFEKRIKNMQRYIHELNDIKKLGVHEVVSKKETKYLGEMTIGEFLSLAQKYQPIIQFRYKGLGELQPLELRDTTLDPNNRILIKLTVDDMEEDMRKFNILHGNDSDERKLLMKHFKISMEDLDN